MLNWSYKSNEKSINMRDLDNITPLGMNVELSENISLEIFDYDDSYEPETEDFTLTRNSGCAIPFHHSMHACIKETCKQEDHVSDEIKAHVDLTLNGLLGTVVTSVSTELNQNIDNKNKNTYQSSCNNKCQGHFKSI